MHPTDDTVVLLRKLFRNWDQGFQIVTMEKLLDRIMTDRNQMKKLILFSIKGTTFSLIVILIMTGCLAFNIRDNYNRLKYGVLGVYLECSSGKMLEHEVYAYVLSLNQDNFTKPRNAYLDFFYRHNASRGLR